MANIEFTHIVILNNGFKFLVTADGAKQIQHAQTFHHEIIDLGKGSAVEARLTVSQVSLVYKVDSQFLLVQ